ncbi:MAG: hypothetical protein AMJ78_01805 [Omnitrophica WOR_2 bacterium SM23_29]|nr:MAG: hypothetical protein AMJ78_01805 [Omnitrophica WOR_2 bacterium SM23_29]
MKLIDEKGRLFGLVNLIDFFVVLFLLAMIPALYFGTKIIFMRPVVEEPFGADIKEISLNCQLIKLGPDVAEAISPGDKETDNKGRVIGEIIELGEIEPYINDATLKQRPARLKLKAQFKDNDLYYKDSIIDGGLELVFKTDKYNVIAKIKDDTTRMLAMRVTLKDLDPDAINLIAVGDTEIDADGQVIAEIVKLGRPEDNISELNLTGGNFTIIRDTEKKQLATEMLLRCQTIDEGSSSEVYFRGKKMTYWQPVEIATNKYKAKGLVSKSYEFIVPERQVRWAAVMLDFRNVEAQISNIIDTGDVEKDFFGSTVARVVKIVSKNPSELVVVNGDKIDKFTLPNKKDLVLALDIRCEERDNLFYFKNNSVKMGNPITFSTELYSITGTIIGIEVK